MKLTPELIERSLSYINAVKDRELDLRGNKIPAIENLGVSKDQNDTIDLTDNDIRVLGNFPLLRRVKTLLLANNRITRIDPQIFEFLPNLTTLVLTNNNVSELSDLEPLSGCYRLQYISLLDNPVTRKQWYRSWIIWKVKSVRVLDFKRVRDVVSEMTSLAKSISEVASKTFEPGEGFVSSKGVNLPKSNLPTLGMSIEEQSKIKLLQSGHIPGSKPGEIEEDDEEMED
ncbi:21088_t:CDS:2 [Rhizophagus irregularis]|nr:21088_t:CDS:2 [Rhizophagus irregularis]